MWSKFTERSQVLMCHSNLDLDNPNWTQVSDSLRICIWLKWFCKVLALTDLKIMAIFFYISKKSVFAAIFTELPLQKFISS